MLGGRASGYTDSEQNADQVRRYHAWSNEEVYRKWGLVPVEIEMCVQRLKWLQVMLKNKTHHGHILAALFGHCRAFEPAATLTEEGALHPSANPWAKQLEKDVLYLLRRLESSTILAERVRTDSGSVNFMMLLVDEDTIIEFTNIDLSELRAAFLSHRIPPPGVPSAPPEPASEIASSCEEGYRCECVNEDDTICNLVFRSFVGLQTHVRRAHNFASILDRAVVTNQCFWCLSTFASKTVAQEHMRRALRHHRCITDQSRIPYSAVVPDEIVCPLCPHDFTELEDLQRHIRSSHLPPLEDHQLVLEGPLPPPTQDRSQANFPERAGHSAARGGDIHHVHREGHEQHLLSGQGSSGQLLRFGERSGERAWTGATARALLYRHAHDTAQGRGRRQGQRGTRTAPDRANGAGTSGGSSSSYPLQVEAVLLGRAAETHGRLRPDTLHLPARFDVGADPDGSGVQDRHRTPRWSRAGPPETDRRSERELNAGVADRRRPVAVSRRPAAAYRAEANLG